MTAEASPRFVPPSERIAVFDNDGTLWAEQPTYVQLAFAIERVKALAPQHPEWREPQEACSKTPRRRCSPTWTRVMDVIPTGDPSWGGRRPSPATSTAPYRIYNIGNNRPEELLDLISILEGAIGRKAVKELVPMQPGDVLSTAADVASRPEVVGFAPSTPLSSGIPRFVDWYREYYRV